MTPSTTGVNVENTTIGGNLTISGITIQNIAQMVERPQLWINVPILPREFVGRDALIAGLVARLTAGQSTALSAEGLPGVGKTALAVVLAHHPAVLAHFADGVLWAGLGPQGDAMSALAAWGMALGVDVTDKPTPQQRCQAVRNAVGQRRLLLVIDDAWDLAAAEPLRCGGPGCAHLLTTRDQALARDFAGARHEVAVPELAENPAFDLLRRLAPEACAVDPAAARRLAQAVGGLPLALELVAGFLAAPEHSFFPELSAESWGVMADPAQRLQLATVRLGAFDDRQVTLQDTIALSLEHLPPPAVDAFYALGAFAPKPATFDLAAAKAVTEASAATLATLIARGLVEQAGPETLALHQTVADVARTALPLAAIERLRDHYLALVDEDREDWERIQGVYPQVQQALAWQVNHQPDDARLLDFYWSLGTYHERQGLWEGYAQLVGLCLTWAQAHQDHRQEATFLNALGVMHDALGDKQKALDYYNRALPIHRQVGHRAGEAMTLNNIGAVYRSLGDMRQALDYYHQALPITRQVGDRWGETVTLNNIGQVYAVLGDKQQALAYFNQALPLHRQFGDRAMEATTLNNIGGLYDALGDKRQALDYCNQALPIFRQVGDRAGEATTLNNIGLLYFALGDKQQALAYFNQALPLHRQFGNRVMEATTLNNIGGVYNALGDKHQALAYFNQALPLHRQFGDRAMEATTLNNIGGLYDALGDKRQALDYCNQALPIFRQVGDRAGEATTLNNIGLLYFALGDKQQALAYFNQALPLRRQVGDRAGEATTLYNIGEVYRTLGDNQQALAYCNQALPIFSQVGDQSGEVTTLNNMAIIYYQLGDTERSAQLLERAVQLYQEVGAAQEEANALYNLAFVRQRVGATDQALKHIGRSVDLMGRYNLPVDSSGRALADHKALLDQLQAALPSGQHHPKRSWRNLFDR